MISKIWK